MAAGLAAFQDDRVVLSRVYSGGELVDIEICFLRLSLKAAGKPVEIVVVNAVLIPDDKAAVSADDEGVYQRAV